MLGRTSADCEDRPVILSNRCVVLAAVNQSGFVHAYSLRVIARSKDIYTRLINNNNNNNNSTQDDIYSAVYTAPAICESSLWLTWTKLGQRQVAANS